jgi:hypothetical protein
MEALWSLLLANDLVVACSAAGDAARRLGCTRCCASEERRAGVVREESVEEGRVRRRGRGETSREAGQKGQRGGGEEGKSGPRQTRAYGQCKSWRP